MAKKGNISLGFLWESRVHLRYHRMGKRQRKKQMDKAERKNLKLWAEGAREEVLSQYIEVYGDACARGYISERDCLLICNHYHQVIDWCLEDHEEPSLPLPEYDPKCIDKDEGLSTDEIKGKQTKIGQMNMVSTCSLANMVTYWAMATEDTTLAKILCSSS